MTLLEAMAASGQSLLESPKVASLVVLMMSIVAYGFWPARSGRPPALPDLIPYLSNTYQYMTDMRAFLWRAAQALRLDQVVSFQLGPKKVYLVTGAQNVQSMFRTSTSISSDKFMVIVWENIWGFSKEGIAKFANDKSGRLKNPAPGTEDTPDNKRYWASFHRVIHDHLALVSETNKLFAMYQKLFTERLEAYPIGAWSEVRIIDFMRKEMLESAVITMVGPRMLELNPDFLEVFWKFDKIAASLAWGLPKWLNREAWQIRGRLLGGVAKYLKAAWASFDWNGPDADADWEPIFGSRLTRELAKWADEYELELETSAGGMLSSILFGLNANTIPITIWSVMELVKDPALFNAVREEVLSVSKTDAKTQRPVIDMQALVSLPLLQSIYTEVLRLHVSINVTREIIEPIMLKGYQLEPGALLQAPSEIAQYNEQVWSAEGHPASEFWAERHIKHEIPSDGTGNGVPTPQFTMAGRSNDFFPYGGGVSICPGRFFAKQEILWTVAVLVTRFEIEFIEWTNLDGSPSDRPAENDVNWAGGASEPPDREMKIRWKRLW